ncbi:hypothetical protein ACFLYA_01730, partial [Candidatus Dependentiae bacterium]
MRIKKFLTLITLISIFYNQFSLCMLNCFKGEKGEEKQYSLEKIIIKDSAKKNLCELPDEI